MSRCAADMGCRDTTAPAFPRSARLLKPPQFQRVFAHGRRLGVPGFQLHVLAHAPAPLAAADAAPVAASCTRAGAEHGARLGLAVSRRVDRRAVVRNRIKRSARELFRSLRAELPAADYVLVARREAAQMSPPQLRAALQSLLRRAAALKPAQPGGTMPAAARAAAPPHPPTA